MDVNPVHVYGNIRVVAITGKYTQRATTNKVSVDISSHT